MWTSTRPSSVSAVGGLKTTASDYHSEVLPEASSPTQASFGESTSFSDRYRSFFVAPSNNNYTFHIQADDQAELYLSLSESAAAKVSVRENNTIMAYIHDSHLSNKGTLSTAIFFLERLGITLVTVNF